MQSVQFEQSLHRLQLVLFEFPIAFSYEGGASPAGFELPQPMVTVLESKQWWV